MKTDFFYGHCCICNSVIPSGDFLCIECRSKFEKERLDSFLYRCPVCGYPRLAPEYVCSNCARDNSIPIMSLNDYSGTYSRDVIEHIKFDGAKKLVPFVASDLSHALDKIDSLKNAVIVPVPCSPSSLKKRGWDQMLEICRHIKRPCIKAIVHNNNATLQQKTLTKEQRRLASLNKYSFNSSLSDKETELLKTRPVVIFDDIFTTGSTIYAIADILRTQKISNISALTWLCEL